MTHRRQRTILALAALSVLPLGPFGLGQDPPRPSEKPPERPAPKPQERPPQRPAERPQARPGDRAPTPAERERAENERRRAEQAREAARPAERSNLRALANEVYALEHAHRKHNARISRLIAVYREKGNLGRVQELEELRRKDSARYENALRKYKTQLGEENWAKVMASMNKGAPGRREASAPRRKPERAEPPRPQDGPVPPESRPPENRPPEQKP